MLLLPFSIMENRKNIDFGLKNLYTENGDFILGDDRAGQTAECEEK